MIQKVISGGQTGADIGGLIAAKKVGLQTGGWMPNGFKTQDGPKPEYAGLYGVVEHESPRYPPRTAMNVKDSDATIRIATNFYSAGEKLTERMIAQYGKPFFDIDPLDESVSPLILVQWLKSWKVRTLNVAGNSEKSSPGIGEFTIAFLFETFTELTK